MKYGLIAGNGKFPLLVIEGARRAGASLSVAAIREETDPEIDRVAERVEWVGIGQLGKMIRFFRSEGVEQAIMAGQVKHVQIFSSSVPDVRMLKMLLKLPRRNTRSLIGAVAEELKSEGIELIESTRFLQHLIPRAGTLTQRAPDACEREDIAYGQEISNEIARIDLGQTIIVRAKACVAIEAMEGTDATILRAGELTRGAQPTSDRDAKTGFGKVAGELSGALIRGRANLTRGHLTVVKLAKPDQDMRFDVPVIGVPTIAAMIEAGATCLCTSAEKTLMLDRDELLALANKNNIAIIAV